MKKTESSAEIPYSMFKGKLNFGGRDIECHVLSDGRRVFTQNEIFRLITGASGSGNLTQYLDRIPIENNTLSSRATITFRIPGLPTPAEGREATGLIEICDAYVEARERGLLKPSQKKLAIQAGIILRACAKVGIIALVDEATGYQQQRAKNALQLKLQAFIADEIGEWAKAFPNEFWYELARLEGIHYSPRSRPLRWGKYVMMFVYDAIDGDVGRELRKRNPNPHFKQNHHQWLQKFGKDQLTSHLAKVVTIMKLCDDMQDFKKKFGRVFKKTPLQLEFNDILA